MICVCMFFLRLKTYNEKKNIPSLVVIDLSACVMKSWRDIYKNQISDVNLDYIDD